MPSLIKMYITQCLIGFGLATVFVAGLLYMNVANLWHLVVNTDGGFLALAMLWVANGLVFAGVQFGIAVMRMQERDSDGPRGGGKLIPIRVEETSRPKRRL